MEQETNHTCQNPEDIVEAGLEYDKDPAPVQECCDDGNEYANDRV